MTNTKVEIMMTGKMDKRIPPKRYFLGLSDFPGNFDLDQVAIFFFPSPDGKSGTLVLRRRENKEDKIQESPDDSIEETTQY